MRECKQFDGIWIMRRTQFVFFALAVCVSATAAQGPDGADEYILLRTKRIEAVDKKTTTGNITDDDAKRVVGGVPISIRDAPWQVALIRDRVFLCGGSIISAIWVLTAAHCVKIGAGVRYVVRVGSDTFKRGGQLRSVEFIARNGAYSSETQVNDIAMLRVGKSFDFGDSVRPIKLPPINTYIPYSFTLSGWGIAHENATNPTLRLRQTQVERVSRRKCAVIYQTDNQPITKSMLCTIAPGRDSCQGDSGGALVRGGVQYGIISFGIGCAKPGYPGINTSVAHQLIWIMAVVRSFRSTNRAPRSTEQNYTKVGRL